MSKRNITDIKGQTKKIACLGCAIQKGEVDSPGGSVLSSKYFDAHQDYEIPIPGFIIIASKRHLQSVDEFTEAEQRDFIKFLSDKNRKIFQHHITPSMRFRTRKYCSFTNCF